MDINQLIHQIKIPLLTNPPELEYFTIHQQRYKIILQKIASLNLPPQSKVLDIGCFPLHLFHALEREPFQFHVTGIASNHEPMNEKNIMQLNIEKDPFPFKPNTFDLAVMTEVIEHLTGNPEVYLEKIKRVLKPGGNLLITTPNAVHLKNRAKMLLGRSPHFPLSQLIETNLQDDSIYHRHNREFTREELKKIILNSQFSILNSTYVSFYTPFRAGKKFNVVKTVGYGITQLLPSMKDSLLIVAKNQ